MILGVSSGSYITSVVGTTSTVVVVSVLIGTIIVVDFSCVLVEVVISKKDEQKGVARSSFKTSTMKSTSLQRSLLTFLGGGAADAN